MIEDHGLRLDLALVDKGRAPKAPSRRPHGGSKGLLGEEDSERPEKGQEQR